MIKLKNKVLIYVPVYNAGHELLELFKNLPEFLFNKSVYDWLIIDNCSTDNAINELMVFLNKSENKLNLIILKTSKNLGYAGSQKLAYSIFSNQNEAKKIIMLHSDGQYDPKLIKSFIPYFKKNNDIVYGARDKNMFPKQEETPISTYLVIKTISLFASLISGIKEVEWVSGFRMFDKNFLNRIPFQNLSDKPFFDGDLLIMSNLLNNNTANVPIYKKYINKKASFTGLSGLMLVLDIINTSFLSRTNKYKKLIDKKNKFSDNYSITFNNIN